MAGTGRMPASNPRPRKGGLREWMVGAVILLLLLPGVTPALAEKAIPINENWQFLDFRNSQVLADEEEYRGLVMVSPRRTSIVGIRASDYDEVQKIQLQSDIFFHFGWSTIFKAGSRIIMVGLPYPFCASRWPLGVLIEGRVDLEIEIDGNPAPKVWMTARCGNIGMIRESEIGSRTFSQILGQMRRGRQATGWLVRDGERLFGYQFSLIGFTEAISLMKR